MSGEFYDEKFGWFPIDCTGNRNGCLYGKYPLCFGHRREHPSHVHVNFGVEGEPNSRFLDWRAFLETHPDKVGPTGEKPAAEYSIFNIPFIMERLPIDEDSEAYKAAKKKFMYTFPDGVHSITERMLPRGYPFEKEIGSMGWTEAKQNTYLSGYPNSLGSNFFCTLGEAMTVCEEHGAGGVTKTGDNAYEVRDKNTPQSSPTGEVSWVRQ